MTDHSDLIERAGGLRTIFGEDEDTPLCPICGASSPRECEEADHYGGECPWELTHDDPEDADD